MTSSHWLSIVGLFVLPAVIVLGLLRTVRNTGQHSRYDQALSVSAVYERVNQAPRAPNNR